MSSESDGCATVAHFLFFAASSSLALAASDSKKFPRIQVKCR